MRPALAPPPRVPAVSAPSQPKPVAVGRKSADPKSKATKKDSQVTADFEAATELDPVQKRPGLIRPRGSLRPHLRQRQLASNEVCIPHCDQVAQGDRYGRGAVWCRYLRVRRGQRQPVTFDYNPLNKLTGLIEKIVT